MPACPALSSQLVAKINYQQLDIIDFRAMVALSRRRTSGAISNQTHAGVYISNRSQTLA